MVLKQLSCWLTVGIAVLLRGTKFGGVLGLLVAVPTASFIKRVAETLRASHWVDA